MTNIHSLLRWFLLSAFSFLLTAPAPGQTNPTATNFPTVYANTRSFRNLPAGRAMIFTPQENPITDGTNLYWVAALLAYPTNGLVVISNMVPGNYTVSMQGVPGSWTVPVPYTNGYLNLVPMSTNLLTWSWNGIAPVYITNILTSPLDSLVVDGPSSVHGPLTLGDAAESSDGQISMVCAADGSTNSVYLHLGNWFQFDAGARFNGPVYSPYFVGDLALATNASPALATNAATATDGMVLSKQGNNLKLVAMGGSGGGATNGFPMTSDGNGSGYSLTNLNVLSAQHLRGEGSGLSGISATHMAGTVALTDLGAIGDGATDNTLVISNALAMGTNLYVPPGVFLTRAVTTSIPQHITFAAGAQLLFHPLSIGNLLELDGAGNTVEGPGTLDGVGGANVFFTSPDGMTNSSYVNIFTSTPPYTSNAFTYTIYWSGFTGWIPPKGPRNGLYINPTGNGRVSDLSFLNFSGTALTVQGTEPDENKQINHYFIRNNYFTNNGCAMALGTGVNGAEYGVVMGNKGFCNSYFLDVRCANIEITGNSCNWAALGLYIHPPFDPLAGSQGRSHDNIVGNTINHCGWAYYIANANTGLNMTGNNFLGCVQANAVEGTSGLQVNSCYFELVDTGLVDTTTNAYNAWNIYRNNTFIQAYGQTGTNLWSGFTNKYIWYGNVLIGNSYSAATNNGFIYPPAGTNLYSASGQAITLSGDATGRGAANIAVVVTNVQGTLTNPIATSGSISATSLAVASMSIGVLTLTNPPILNLSASTNLNGATAIQAGTINSNSLDSATRAMLGTGGAGGAVTNLTPWNSDVNGANFALTNVAKIVTTNLMVSGSGTNLLGPTIVTNVQFIGTASGNISGNAATATAAAGSPWLTANQSISISGDASGSGATSIALAVTNMTGSFCTATNAWAANTPLPLGLTNGIISSGATTLGITGVANLPTAQINWGLVTIYATGDVILTNPSAFASCDFKTSRTVTNGNCADVMVKVIPGVRTNLVVLQYR